MDDSENKPSPNQELEVLDEFLEELLEAVTKPKQFSETVVRDTVVTAFEEAGFPNLNLPIEVIHFRQTLVEESDRGCALSAAAYIDYQMALLIQSVLLEDKKVVRDTFTGTGPLATFSSRINIAYLLGLIGRKAMHDLHTIRKIRNDFAHKPDNIAFSDEPIASLCRSLHHDAWQEVLPPRKKFVRVVLGVIAVIHSAIKKATRPEESIDADITGMKLKEIAENIRIALEKQIELLKKEPTNASN